MIQYLLISLQFLFTNSKDNIDVKITVMQTENYFIFSFLLLLLKEIENAGSV